MLLKPILEHGPGSFPGIGSKPLFNSKFTVMMIQTNYDLKTDTSVTIDFDFGSMMFTVTRFCSRLKRLRFDTKEAAENQFDEWVKNPNS